MSLNASECNRTPPDLKWLLNQRAAYLGELSRVQARAIPLQGEIARLEATLAKLKASLGVIENAGKAIQADIKALDVALDVMHGQVNKEAVKPVVAWAGRYGERGAQKKFIISFLKASYPHPVKTMTIVDALRHRFDLDISTPKERQNLRCSVRKTLYLMRDVERLVESSHSRNLGTPDCLWRWKELLPTLEQLRVRTQESADDLAKDGPLGQVGHQ